MTLDRQREQVWHGMAFLNEDPSVPKALRAWFVVHFVADIAFALPLLVAPAAFGALLGFTQIDPVTARLVGAALVGIGTESLLCRNEGRERYQTMLRLKVLWSSTAWIGLAVSALQGAPPMTWGLSAIFISFCALWSYWAWRLRAPSPSSSSSSAAGAV